MLTNGSSARGGSGRGLLKERAYAEIKRRILGGKLAPGPFLAERQLAAQLGMSKTPVRSALERLESEGFLSISPQQGAIIRDLSVPEIADQYEIRMAIEAFVVRDAGGQADATAGRPGAGEPQGPAGEPRRGATWREASRWTRNSTPSSASSWATRRSSGSWASSATRPTA